MLTRTYYHESSQAEGEGRRNLIHRTASDLATKPSIPGPVVDLLRAVADTQPTDIVAELDHGRLAAMIDALDPTSRQIAVEVVTELRLQHEELEMFEEAAGLDLVRDRLGRKLVQPRLAHATPGRLERVGPDLGWIER